MSASPPTPLPPDPIGQAVREEVDAGPTIRDPNAQQILRLFNVAYERLTPVTPDRFDLDASMLVQARLKQRVDPERVGTYTEYRLNGMKPPDLVADGSPDRLRIIGGLHRYLAALEAQKRGEQGIAFGVLHVTRYPDLATRDSVPFLLNALGVGKEVPKRDITDRAIKWMDDFGRSVTEAAHRFKVVTGTITTRRRAESVRSRLQRRRFATPLADIPDARLARLDALTTNRVLHAAVELTADADLTADEGVADLVRAVQEAKDDQDAQLDAVTTFRRRPEIAERIRQMVERREPKAGRGAAPGRTGPTGARPPAAPRLLRERILNGLRNIVAGLRTLVERQTGLSSVRMDNAEDVQRLRTLADEVVALVAALTEEADARARD